MFMQCIFEPSVQYFPVWGSLRVIKVAPRLIKTGMYTKNTGMRDLRAVPNARRTERGLRAKTWQTEPRAGQSASAQERRHQHRLQRVEEGDEEPGGFQYNWEKRKLAREKAFPPPRPAAAGSHVGASDDSDGSESS